MLEICDLHAQIEGAQVLKGLSLSIKPGEVHALIGPNGSGKSSLAHIITGHPAYEVTKGSIKWEKDLQTIDLTDTEPSERALMGIFLAYQYPVEVGGLNNFEFLFTAFKNMCQHQGVQALDKEQFRALVQKQAISLGLDKSFLDRNLNEGFSGGEKKRNEILQMLILRPRLALLDETDSGLDADALSFVASGVRKYHNAENAILLITHYPKLLDEIQPQKVHIIDQGTIVQSGGLELGRNILTQGYKAIK